jgi:hypothetical protein
MGVPLSMPGGLVQFFLLLFSFDYHINSFEENNDNNNNNNNNLKMTF